MSAPSVPAATPPATAVTATAATPTAATPTPATTWVLYNVAHAESAIRSSDGDAWLRVLGVFGSREAAQRHTRALVAHDRGIEIRVAPLGEFRMLLRSRYNDVGGIMDMATRERETAKHGALLGEHAKRRRAAAEQTAANARDRKMGALAFSPQDRMTAYAEEMLAAGPDTSAAAMTELKAPDLTELKTSDLTELKTSELTELEAPVLTTPATGGAGAEAPAARSIPPQLEVRMQKFMALAVVPDYEHAAALDARLRGWEDSRDRAFASVRNRALAAAVRPGEPLPTPRDLMREWVCANPPPAGYNVWGQRMTAAAEGGVGGGAGDERDSVWARIVTTTAETTAPTATTPTAATPEDGGGGGGAQAEADAWCRAFKVNYEAALWPALGISPPDRGGALRGWVAANPMPSSTAGAEPAVALLHAGDTEDEVREWIEGASGAPNLRDYDIGCVAMYEWVKVAHAWSEQVKVTYREPVLAKLHANKDAQRREAAALADSGVKVTELSGGAAVALGATPM